jgi:tetratricopeptide (TPR) repeat protein
MIFRDNLAGAYQDAGELGRAISLCEQTLADRLRVLGASHPDTLLSQNNLAEAYRQDGRRDKAISLLRAALADAGRVLGPDHPVTELVRDNLAAAIAEPAPGAVPGAAGTAAHYSDS